MQALVLVQRFGGDGMHDDDDDDDDVYFPVGRAFIFLMRWYTSW